jgi:hypothetical protein
MAELFSSGRVVDLILVLMLVEGLALTLLWYRQGRGVSPPALWVNLAAGAGMLLALRAALVGASWVWVWLALALALAMHVGELRLRWRSTGACCMGHSGADGAAPRCEPL